MTSSNPKNTLLIFVKQPIPKRVKTRLGKSIGHRQAAQVYQKLLAHTQKLALAVKAQRQVWYGHAIAPNDLWSRPEFSQHLQPQEDLGQRMAAAFQQAFNQGSQKVVIIGSDCPRLTTAIVEEAFATLAYKDVVLGPAIDGGFYLLGLRAWRPIFKNVAWSTANVLSQTLKNVKDQGLSYQTLTTLSDLDTVEDLKQFPEYDPQT
jgi:rSAM/selenodomain-associated transferase 1